MPTHATRRPVDLEDLEHLDAIKHLSSEAQAKKLYKIQLTAEAKALLLKHKELTAYSYLGNLAYKLCQIDCSIETRVNILQYYGQQFLVDSLRNCYNLSEEKLYSKENYDTVIANADKAIYEAKQRLFEEEKPKVRVFKEDVGIPWNTKYNYAHFDSPIIGNAIYPTLGIYTNKYYVNMDKLFGLESSKKTSLGNTTNPKLSDKELVECFNHTACSSPTLDEVIHSDKCAESSYDAYIIQRNDEMYSNLCDEELVQCFDWTKITIHTVDDLGWVHSYTEGTQPANSNQLQSELASFDKILAVCAEEYQAKAVKYGNSLDDMQLSTLADLLLAKSNRVYSYLADSKELLVNESIANDLRAIINYAIVSVIKDSKIHFDYDLDKLYLYDELQAYQAMVQEARAILQSKNADYDQAWKQFAISSLADLIKVKVIRVKNMLANNDYSSLADNYFDIINYAVFTLIRLEDK